MGKHKAPMRKYVVLGGEHNHHGVTYKKGEVVECGVDLTKIFENKFRYFVSDVEEDLDEGVSDAGESEMSWGRRYQRFFRCKSWEGFGVPKIKILPCVCSRRPYLSDLGQAAEN